ncbi:hypothetical protein BC832DRAFT_547792 [Gaertneriomyces semiglobifer]|nr:hypothetical protein BC832DRAFT_547792 [Gaertneriomyces semiglobifer]
MSCTCHCLLVPYSCVVHRSVCHCTSGRFHGRSEHTNTISLPPSSLCVRRETYQKLIDEEMNVIDALLPPTLEQFVDIFFPTRIHRGYPGVARESSYWIVKRRRVVRCGKMRYILYEILLPFFEAVLFVRE